jgi:stringent starvation protein B
MRPSRPYLLRAFYEWISDNEWAPYLVINANYPDVEVPQQYVEEGRIILDVSAHAIRNLTLANSHIMFDARFSGVPFEVYAPIRAVTAIYAKENGRGMVFKEDEEGEEEAPPPRGKLGVSSGNNTKTPPRGKGKLVLIKTGKEITGKEVN